MVREKHLENEISFPGLEIFRELYDCSGKLKIQGTLRLFREMENSGNFMIVQGKL